MVAARLVTYSHGMTPKPFPKLNETGFMLCAALLITSTGCVGYVNGPRHGYVARTAVSAPVVMAQEDYVYYPGYQMYYGSRSHQYYYQEGSSWVARPAPQGVSVNVLLGSPSVAMDFHDGPAMHHAQVVQTYPRTWTKSGGNNGRKTDLRKRSKDDKRDERNR